MLRSHASLSPTGSFKGQGSHACPPVKVFGPLPHDSLGACLCSSYSSMERVAALGHTVACSPVTSDLKVRGGRSGGGPSPSPSCEFPGVQTPPPLLTEYPFPGARLRRHCGPTHTPCRRSELVRSDLLAPRARQRPARSRRCNALHSEGVTSTWVMSWVAFNLGLSGLRPPATHRTRKSRSSHRSLARSYKRSHRALVRNGAICSESADTCSGSFKATGTLHSPASSSSIPGADNRPRCLPTWHCSRSSSAPVSRYWPPAVAAVVPSNRSTSR